jgi:hypothetical protein
MTPPSFAVPAALATLALVVSLVGVGAASATRLCATNTAPCANVYPADTRLHATLTPGSVLEFTTAGSPVGVNPTFSCADSTAEFTLRDSGGGAGTVVRKLLRLLTITGCTSTGPTGCSSSGTVGSLTAATGPVAWTSGTNGTLTFTPPTVSFSCPILGAPVTCTFGGSGTLDATETGGNTAVIDFVGQPLASTGGFGCPTSSTLNARYQTVAPVYVTNS